MKNFYLNFCKLATLVLMVGLTTNFFSTRNVQTFAQVGGPPESVAICHSTSSNENPYNTQSPNIQNDGSLTGGHLNHSVVGVFPTTPWGDIIPPYTSGNFSYPGLNWNDEGRAIYLDECAAPHKTVAITESVSCGAGEKTFSGTADFKGDNSDQHIVVTLDDVQIMDNHDESTSWTTPATNVALGSHTLKVTIYDDGHSDKDAEDSWQFTLDSCPVVDVCADIEGTQETVPTGYYQSGENCPQCAAAKSCSNECGQAATQVPNGSCGFISCAATPACPNPTPSPDPSPSVSPSPSPSPTEPPGYNCPIAQSCSTACGQGAQDVPNGSCGFNHCDPTPACTSGEVLGASTSNIGGTSGQVLGASTYAATGVTEDILFSLLGFSGAGLSATGILMRRNAKGKK